MKRVLTGSTGLVGAALRARWQAEGHPCLCLVRGAGPGSAREVTWNPLTETLADPGQLDGAEAVVHLAGRNIACRWTPAHRAAIRDSRVRGTAFLARILAGLQRPPSVFLSASATGYYGDTGGRNVDESSGPGDGFLAEVCREWEAAAAPAAEAGIRVIHLRTGVVLSPTGGMLGKILPLFRAGMGGRIGDGRQVLSWISLPDLVGAIAFLINTSDIRGPVNLVSPKPVTNAAFTHALAQALSRPARFPVPAFALRMLLGQMATETALVSSRVSPAVLVAHRYPFQHPGLEEALRDMIGAW